MYPSVIKPPRSQQQPPLDNTQPLPAIAEQIDREMQSAVGNVQSSAITALKLVSDDVKALEDFHMKLAPHSLAIAAASAMAAWPLGRVIAGRLFPSSRLLARVGFRTALWSSMTAVGISQYSSYRHSQLSERLSFCWDVQTRYGMWRFRAPRGLQTEIIKYTFGRWHEMALRRDPEVIDPLELAEFLDATLTCGQFYLEVMCNAEAGNKTIDEALKFYLPSYPRESDGLGLLPNEGRWANPGASQNDGSSRNGIDPQVKDSQRKEKWNWWATKADDEVNAQNGTNSSTKRYP